MNSFKNIVFTILIIFLTFSCDNESSKKDKEKKNLQSILLQALSSTLFGDPGANAAKIFYVDPTIVATSTSLDLIAEATPAHVNPAKKKIILIHGWDYNDKDTKAFSINEQKARAVTDGWANFINSSTLASVLAKNYDVYAFDYLTSNTIDANGKRFRTKMDSLFGNETGTVVILAHSMGGLVSRFAIYEGDKPNYINRIITLGTPFHGSPWASPQFQGDMSKIGEIAAFLTSTNGGKDLAWDNFDGKISGASNAKLTAINAKTDRDNLFFAYYGSVNASGSGASGTSSPGLYAACVILGSNFAPSDCIVPASSASLSGNTLTQIRDLGSYDHLDIKLSTPTIQTIFYNDIP